MTVGELIEELRKYPAHYMALLEVRKFNPDGERMEWEMIYVADVELQTNVGDLGCAVKIVSAE